MNKKTNNLKIGSACLVAVEILLVLIFKLLLKLENIDFLVYIFLAANSLWLVYVFVMQTLYRDHFDLEISRIVGMEAKDAMDYGQVGIVVCDENSVINWTSGLLLTRELCKAGQTITDVIPDAMSVLTGNETSVTVELNHRKYEITRGENDGVLFIKDVDELIRISRTYNNERIVEGLINLDNYNETVLYEDEQKIAIINTNIRQKLIEWVSECGGVVKRMRSNRLLVYISEQKFQKMLRSKFKILEEVKKEAMELDVVITASMAFARGYSNLAKLDETVTNLMELALSRGGDQVIIKENGRELQFFGTSSEAVENTSKVKAKAMAQSLIKLIDDSSNVIIVPHTEADLDAVGSSIALSNLARYRQKEAYIIADDIKVEGKAKEILDEYRMEMLEHHTFTGLKEAKSMMNENTLVIVTDHHSLDLDAAPKLVSSSKRVVIVDHHRRKSEDNIQSIMIYNEPSASCSVELVSEMLQYQNDEVEISPLEATIMYAGLLVDTDDLKNRTTSRTFETCAYLRRVGADVQQANDWLKESMEEIVLRNEITRNMEVVDHSLAICASDNVSVPLTRTSLAKAANYLCSIRDIDAAFVFGVLEDETVSMSARSNGSVNVQIILEKLGGGGHFDAAGLQRKDITVAALKEELLESIYNYLQGGVSDESNITE